MPAFHPGNKFEPAPDADGGMLGPELFLVVIAVVLASLTTWMICGR